MVEPPTDRTNFEMEEPPTDRTTFEGTLETTTEPRIDRSFKETALREVLDRYHLFLNLPNYPEDARLVFFLTLCRMIDRGIAAATTSAGEPAADRPPPINFTAIAANEERLFKRYRFDARRSETANLEAFVDTLLDPPADTTVRFL